MLPFALAASIPCSVVVVVGGVCVGGDGDGGGGGGGKCMARSDSVRRSMGTQTATTKPTPGAGGRRTSIHLRAGLVRSDVDDDCRRDTDEKESGCPPLPPNGEEW